jgi:hypothetical protein
MGNSVRQASDGGYIIAGYTRSSGAGYGDVYLIRTDVNGNTVWQKIFGGNLDAKGNAVQLTSDNGYIIVGYKETSSTDYVIEAYLIKTDASGNTVWEKTFGSNK